MSPPIRDGVGDSIESIRLGDGSEISEVRTGAGDVLFSAIPGLIDDFNDGDLSEYGGTNANFDVVTSPTFEGSHALRLTTSSSGTETLQSQSGLDNYPQAGDTIEYRLRHDASSHQLTFWFGDDGSENTYKIRTGNRFNNVQIVKRSNNGATANELASASITFNTGEWYRAVIDWASNGDITVTIFDNSGSQQAQASANDSSYTSGGIGWGSNAGSNGENAYADIVRII